MLSASRPNTDLSWRNLQTTTTKSRKSLHNTVPGCQMLPVVCCCSSYFLTMAFNYFSSVLHKGSEELFWIGLLPGREMNSYFELLNPPASTLLQLQVDFCDVIRLVT